MIKTIFREFYIVTLLMLMVTVPSGAVNLDSAEKGSWPQFHGLKCNSHAPSMQIVRNWSEHENICWKTAIHDLGWSSPVILGDQIWVTTATQDGHNMYAVCVECSTGKILHDILVFKNEDTSQDDLMINSFASCTPCVEAGRVYVHFGRYGTACLDTVTGKKIWERRDLICTHYRGPGSSPLLDGNSLYLHYDGGDKQYVVSLDKRTGKTLWKTNRRVNYGDLDGDLRKAFCTPILITVNDKKQLISVGAYAAFSYRPETGEEIWRVNFKGYSNTSRPVYDGRHVLINTGFGRASLLAVRPDGEGDVTDTHVSWTTKKGVPLKTTPVQIDEFLYMVDDNGVFTCLDLKDGALCWQSRIGGKFSSTPLYVNGVLICCDHGGLCTLIYPNSEKLRVEGKNRLDGEILASPAAVNGSLYFRTRTHLYRVGENRTP